MSLSRFFIDRPIFAWVIAMLIAIAGLAVLPRLPIELYPRVAPTTVVISASYPGASAQTVEDSVTQIIEQAMTGIDGLLYISSSSEADGRVGVVLTFDSDMDPDIAQVQAQNKLQLVTPQLPLIVQQQGLNVLKTDNTLLLGTTFISEDG